jgi:hypothetical protein
MAKLLRSTHATTERLVLIGPTFTVTVELRVTGLELDAAGVERMLHAPLREVADRIGRDAAGRETI